MKRFLFFSFILFVGVSFSFAQKKEINIAKSLIKKGENFDTAEKMMVDLLKDDKNKKNEKIYLTLFESLKKQYELGNEKLYLKEPYDTAALFNVTKKMFMVLESLDSVEVSNKGNEKKLSLRKKHSDFLNSYRRNLFSGGGYFIRKQDYNTAFSYYDMYIGCAKQPLFKKYDYMKNDKQLTMAAYWALYCGFKAGAPSLTLKYVDLALQESSMQEYTLQFLAETYAQIKDREKCVSTLKKGSEMFPASSYFFTRLADYYNEELHDYEKSLALSENALSANGEKLLFLFAKSTSLLNLGRYEECIKVCGRVLELDNALPDAYLNAGLSYFNLAIISKNKKETSDLYRQSMEYMEKYKKMAPDDIERWGSVLYNIYLNLNLGSKFDEIDKMINEAK